MQRAKWSYRRVFSVLDAILTGVLGIYILFDWAPDWKRTWYSPIFVVLGILLVSGAVSKIYRMIGHDRAIDAKHS
jgi:hypothetical protein